jgi:formylglycine-generating enzyme required for sulfatase activity
MNRPRRRLWLLPLAAAAALAAVAPAPGRDKDDPPAGGKYALVVGVRDYRKDELRSLKYAEDDATDLAQVLREGGWRNVVLMTAPEAKRDAGLAPTADNFRDRFKALLADRTPDDVVLVAFSGHGVRLKGGDDFLLCPPDARLGDVKTLLPLSELYKELAACKARTKVMLLDVCRAEALPDGSAAELAKPGGPQTVKPPDGVTVFYGCAEGERSLESESLRHGAFFHHLIEGLHGRAAGDKGEVTLAGLAKYVKEATPEAVADEFGPWARQRPQLAGPAADSLVLAKVVGPTEKVVVNSLKMRLALIPAGKFQMGSPNGEEGRRDDETQHAVEITRPFYLGAFPVTRGQFAAFVKDAGYKTEAEADGAGGAGYDAATRSMRVRDATFSWQNTGFKQTDDHPVVDVSWNDAVKFCEWLSKKEGKAYELPTEAEWEYACRAGTTTRYWTGDKDESLKGAANLGDAAFKEQVVGASGAPRPWNDGFAFTAPVGSFKANPWGLHDMHGNVWQWCADRYGPYPDKAVKDPAGAKDGAERVLRGGSWIPNPADCRSAFRHHHGPSERDQDWGFRVVLRPDKKAP